MYDHSIHAQMKPSFIFIGMFQCSMTARVIITDKDMKPCFSRIPNFNSTFNNSHWLHGLWTFRPILCTTMIMRQFIHSCIRIFLFLFVKTIACCTHFGKELKCNNQLCVTTDQQSMTRNTIVSHTRATTLPSCISTCSNTNSTILNMNVASFLCYINLFL